MTSGLAAEAYAFVRLAPDLASNYGGSTFGVLVTDLKDKSSPPKMAVVQLLRFLRDLLLHQSLWNPTWTILLSSENRVSHLIIFYSIIKCY